MKTPERVKRCTTHHHACDCREWRIQQMERALKVIQVWAQDGNGPGLLELIEKTAGDALRA